jgi:predicted DNA-binding protein
MSVQIEELLKLPDEERRQIAEQLLNSLDDNFDLSEEDAEDLRIAEERWQSIQQGTSKLLSENEFKVLVDNKFAKFK